MIMFKRFLEKLKSYFEGPSIRDTFEDMIKQETAKEEAVKEEPAPVVVAAPVVVNNQITDAVTAKPKRTRTTAKKPRSKKK